MEPVILKEVHSGYLRGNKTQLVYGNQKEIILPNGKSILLYDHEYVKAGASFPDRNMTYCACGNSF